MPDLTLRARKILSAIISEFLQTGEAVGSRTVTRRHGISLSPATVRNVMADLEDLGLLEQPHASAGRVPTSAGLRFFIDSLLRVRGLSRQEKDRIRDQLTDRQDVDAILQHASRTLSEITHHAGIVLTPLPERQRFQHIEFVPLKSGKALCILVTTAGQIENKLIDLPADMDPRRLERIHNYLDQMLGGLTLEEVRRKVLEGVGEAKSEYDGLVAEALRLGRAALVDGPKSADVIVSGGANLVDTAHAQDPAQLERVQKLLRTLEDKEVLLGLLDRTLAGEGIQVFLGHETAMAALGGSSVVSVSYGPEDRPLGAIAVIGPMRMNYGKVMSVVDFTADLVGEIIGKG